VAAAAKSVAVLPLEKLSPDPDWDKVRADPGFPALLASRGIPRPGEDR
jgi:hypothetical protein